MLRSFARELLAIADRLDRRGASHSPICASPRADLETYQALFGEARQIAYPEIDAFEASVGMAIDREFLDQLAFHTQVAVKRSRPSWAHGRVLYAALRDYLRRAPASGGDKHVTIFETGTARGFSATCMAKALSDAGRSGTILTFDTLPHDRAIYWNTIDDLGGPRTRRDLLAPWRDLVADHIVFIWGNTRVNLSRVMPERIGFAFLDGQHDYAAVMEEFEHVAPRQEAGDVIVFDDATPQVYPGIVKAVGEIGATRGYTLTEITALADRHYVIARKT